MSTTAAQDASSAHGQYRMSTNSTMTLANGQTTTPTSPVNRAAAKTPRPSKSIIAPVVHEPPTDAGEIAWGSNFWVTLVDPQVFKLTSLLSH
jgi:hypothetical protein